MGRILQELNYGLSKMCLLRSTKPSLLEKKIPNPWAFSPSPFPPQPWHILGVLEAAGWVSAILAIPLHNMPLTAPSTVG